eukprot:GHRR01013430.1.p1 GENE.GHRR01013430.1~~GHRR01013430.1.p1  ORF type:complete len:166 (+),score=41.45 GHRR01013430.1:340-837(+)
MMVNYLLCKSEYFQNTATAVVDILGGIGESFISQCTPKKLLPHLILHGTEDPVITYSQDTLVDGSKFISTLKMAKWWQGLQGCSGDPQPANSDKILDCTVYCDPASAAAGRRHLSRKLAATQAASSKAYLKLCAMKGVGHDMHTPYQGYPFDIAWDFFKQQAGLP